MIYTINFCQILTKAPFDTLMLDALTGLTQFLATETSLKVMKNYFSFTLKALFALKIFKFLS